MLTIKENAPAIVSERVTIEPCPEDRARRPRRLVRASVERCRRPLPMLRLPRLLWLAIGLAAGVASALVASPWLLAAWLVPDLSLLAAGLPPIDQDGSLKPAAVRAYNATHVLAGPLVLCVVGALTAPIVLALAALWLCHIGIDRALGYRPRNADGAIRGG
jgi:hypothetical protein